VDAGHVRRGTPTRRARWSPLAEEAGARRGRGFEVRDERLRCVRVRARALQQWRAVEAIGQAEAAHVHWVVETRHSCGDGRGPLERCGRENSKHFKDSAVTGDYDQRRRGRRRRRTGRVRCRLRGRRARCGRRRLREGRAPGRPGGLGPDSTDAAGFLDYWLDIADLEFEDIPADVIEQELEDAEFIGPTERVSVDRTGIDADYDGFGFTFHRAKFDDWLRSRAEDAGAEYVVGTTVKSVDSDLAGGHSHTLRLGDGEAVTTEYLVLADGPSAR